ncbi:MAG: MATE family efflux transporter [Ignavibacteria bacterium]|nr:MATE family efflux transporter [Ignavibacteria bacterium]
MIKRTLTSNKLRVNLLADPIDTSLRMFAIPLTFSFLVQFIYSLIDRFYVSRLGVEAIAAIGASDQIAFLVFTLASGFGVGTGILVARRVGEGNYEDAGLVATQAIAAMIVIGLIFTGMLYVAVPYIPALFNLEPQVAQYSKDYMGMLFLGVVGNLLTFQISAIIRSTGNSVFPMVILIMTTIVNAVLAPLLIFGMGPFPEMGMMGAGLATATAQISGAGISLWALITGKANIVPSFKGFKVDFDIIRRIAKQGLPASLQMVSVSLNRVFLFKIVGTYGTAVVAGYTLGLYADMIVFMFVFAMGMAVEVATGQNLGAGLIDRIHGYYKSAIVQLGTLMLAFALVVYLGGESFVRIFTTDPDTIKEALQYLHISIIGYIFFGIGVVSIRVISGAGAAFLSMGITSGSILGIQLPLAYFLSHIVGWGPTGVWTALVTGYIIFAVISHTAYRMGKWQHAKI